MAFTNDSEEYRESVKMQKYQEIVLNLMKKNKRISTFFVANKLKINLNIAQNLCEWAWRRQCRKWFFMRNTNYEEDEIDKFMGTE